MNWWLEVSRFLTVIGSATITLGLYDQARKVLTTKSVNDLSTMLVISLIVNEMVWLNYGTSLGEWPIILISTANIPAVLVIMAGYFKYRESGDRGGEMSHGELTVRHSTSNS